MDFLIALLEARGRTATPYRAILLERLITRAANRVLGRVSVSAIRTIRVFSLTRE